MMLALLFFLMIRPPPRSTLFPFTSLFRSLGLAHGARLRHRPHLQDVRQRLLPGALQAGPALRALAEEGLRQPPGPRRQPRLRDARRRLESRSEEHTSELQSRQYLVCRLLLEKKKKTHIQPATL